MGKRRSDIDVVRDLEETHPKDTRNRGEYSINTVKVALRILKSESTIAGYLIAGRNDSLDKRGIDVVIYLSENREILLQVKSHRRSIDTHFRKYPNVKNVIVIERQPQEIGGRLFLVVTLAQRIANEIIRPRENGSQENIVIIVD